MARRIAKDRVDHEALLEFVRPRHRPTLVTKTMREQGKSLIRVTIESWGPIATGGFPPELAD